MTSAYEFGYQQQFNLVYLSVGIEDITYTLRVFVLALSGTIAMSIVLIFVIAIISKQDVHVISVDFLFIILPIAFVRVIVLSVLRFWI